MNNIQPWCISRQLWWGIRYRHGMDPMVKYSWPLRKRRYKAETHYGAATELTRMKTARHMVLSALWPFSRWAGRKKRGSLSGIIKRMCWLPASTSFSSGCTHDDERLHFMDDVPFTQSILRAGA